MSTSRSSVDPESVRTHTTAAFWCSLLVLACSFAGVADGQDPRGMWSGMLHTDRDHHVVMRVDGPDLSTLHAALYQDERGTDLPVDTVSYADGALDLSAIHGAVRLHVLLNPTGDTWRGAVTLEATTPLELHRTTEAAAWSLDTSPHTITRIEVDQGVSLEVLDWGGSGPPILLLTGLGNNAHIYDTFAPKLAQTFHVYGLTRRGSGSSTWPPPVDENYTATRLGEDVAAAIHALRLSRPMVVGHSIAGEELSYLGTVYPKLIRGLVYLDAAYAYAYFDPAHPDFTISLNEVRRKLGTLRVSVPPQQIAGTMVELAAHDLPQLQVLLKAQAGKIGELPKNTAPITPPPATAFEAIINGEQKFAAPQCPVLAIFALGDDAARSAPYADAFAAAAPNAKVVRLKDAKHYVFFTNEADVLEAIRSFDPQTEVSKQTAPAYPPAATRAKP